MAKDLTTSAIDRQNILNNRYAVESIQEETGISGVLFEGQYRFTTKQVADFFEIDERTVKRYLADYEKELKNNGYEVLRANQLKFFKLAVAEQLAGDINVTSKITQLGVYNFRAFLNLAMLLTESEKAKTIRSIILDIVIPSTSAPAVVPSISTNAMRILLSIIYEVKIIGKNLQMHCGIM
jgi:hypothetical protein